MGINPIATLPCPRAKFRAQQVKVSEAHIQLLAVSRHSPGWWCRVTREWRGSWNMFLVLYASLHCNKSLFWFCFSTPTLSLLLPGYITTCSLTRLLIRSICFSNYACLWRSVERNFDLRLNNYSVTGRELILGRTNGHRKRSWSWGNLINTDQCVVHQWVNKYMGYLNLFKISDFNRGEEEQAPFDGCGVVKHTRFVYHHFSIEFYILIPIPAPLSLRTGFYTHAAVKFNSLSGHSHINGRAWAVPEE